MPASGPGTGSFGDGGGAYAPLRRPAFRRYLLGSLSSNLSDRGLKVAAGYYLYAATRSAWALALVGLTSYLPILLLSLPGGWAADRFPRKRVLAAALSLQALGALGLLLLVGLGGPAWGWYPLLLVCGGGGALLDPARVSLYPQLVAPGEVPRAVSWNSSNFQISTVAGLLLGGVFYRFLGVAGSLAFAAAGPLVFLALLPGLRILRESPAAAAARERFRDRLLGGFRFVWAAKPILGALSVDFVAVLFGGVDGIMPMFAQDILRCGPLGQGALMAAPFAGALAMSFTLAHRPRLRRPGRAMLLAVAGFGLCTLAFGLSRSLPLSLLALVGAGVLDQVSVYVRQTMVQLRTPPELLGRVQAVNFLFIGSSNQLGEFESGVTAALLGPVGSVLLGGCAAVGVVAAAAAVFPDLRALDSLADGAMGAA